MSTESGGIRIMEDRINPEVFQEFYLLPEEISGEFYPEILSDFRRKMVGMASSGTIESYRQIEKILKDSTISDKERDFAIVALNFCRFKMENDIFDLETDMISGGLGGKDNRLRYYVALTGKEGFTGNYCNYIEKVFKDILSNYDSILEEVQYHEFYFSLLILGSVEHAIGIVLDKAITACGFLAKEYYLTNVEIPTDERIRYWLDGELDESS